MDMVCGALPTTINPLFSLKSVYFSVDGVGMSVFSPDSIETGQRILGHGLPINLHLSPSHACSHLPLPTYNICIPYEE